MNKIIIALLLSLVSFASHAQSQLGIRGSFLVSSMSTGDAKSSPGFDVGIIYSTPISHSWKFQPSILFALDGVRAADRRAFDYSTHTYSLQTPLILSYRMGDDEISFGVDMGLFAKYNLSGKYWMDTPEGRIRPDLFDTHKRFDVGPQLGFSVIAQGIYMGCGMQYGLLKPWTDKKGNYYNYFMAVGYLFEI